MEGRLGACHAVEIPFVFGTTRISEVFSGSGPDAERLSVRIQDAWLAFARTGSPSTDSLAWPAFDAGHRATMVLNRDCGVVEQPREAERLGWEGIVG